jgi:hypothetical protein
MGLVSNFKSALSNLNPNEIRELADRRVRILIDAAGEDSIRELGHYLCPSSMSQAKRQEALRWLARADDPKLSGRFQLVLYQRGMPAPEGWEYGRDAFPFDLQEPDRLAELLLERRSDLSIPLSRLFPPLRHAYCQRTIHTISKENALFSLMTALPNVVPNVFELPWAVGEFASDTTVLTANQVRMAFLMAAASDRPVGYREQRSEIGSILAGAWGWRTVARQLISKVPFGGGLLPKAAIAYAGTYVVGRTLERIYRVGIGLTREEREREYEGALQTGREVAGKLLERLRPKSS